MLMLHICLCVHLLTITRKVRHVFSYLFIIYLFVYLYVCLYYCITLLYTQVAGAMSDEGRSLEEIVTMCKHVNNNMGTVRLHININLMKQYGIPACVYGVYLLCIFYYEVVSI